MTNNNAMLSEEERETLLDEMQAVDKRCFDTRVSGRAVHAAMLDAIIDRLTAPLPPDIEEIRKRHERDERNDVWTQKWAEGAEPLPTPHRDRAALLAHRRAGEMSEEVRKVLTDLVWAAAVMPQAKDKGKENDLFNALEKARAILGGKDNG